jgi:5-methylthioadenosine/S-adenosylhomocysteine deaminase
MQTVDLLITCRYIAPVEPARLYTEHALIVHAGRVLGLEPAARARANYAPLEAIERPDHVLVPGFVNAGTQLAGSLAPESTATLSPRPGVLAPLAPAAIAYALAALVRAGVTTVADLGLFPRLAADSAVAQGLRLVAGLPLGAQASPFAADLDESFAAALVLHDEFRGHPLVRTAFAPRSLGELDDAALGRLRVLVDQLEVPLLVPVQASRAEIEASLARHGAMPLDRLQRLGLWHASTAALGFRYANADAVRAALRGGVCVVHCPGADLATAALDSGAGVRPGEGFSPTAELLAAGVPLALGSGAQGDLEPLALLSLARRLAGAPRAAAPAPHLWLRAATLGGARALGLEASVGSLAPGKWADICCLDLRRLPPRADPLEALLGGGGEAVSDVWVGGRALLREGRHVAVDAQALWARAAAAVAGSLAP